MLNYHLYTFAAGALRGPLPESAHRDLPNCNDNRCLSEVMMAKSQIETMGPDYIEVEAS